LKIGTIQSIMLRIEFVGLTLGVDQVRGVEEKYQTTNAALHDLRTI